MSAYANATSGAVPARRPRAPDLAHYARAEPALCWLFDALARRVEVRGVAGLGWLDLLRLAAGREGYDPLHPRVVPRLPWGAVWRPGFHGALLRPLARAAGTVIFTRPDQAPLLPEFRGCRVIYYAADDYARYGTGSLAEERALVRAAAQVICVSAELARRIGERHGLPAKHIAVSPNGVPAAWIPPDCPGVPSRLPEGLAEKRPLAGVIGRVSSRIRLDWLVRAVEALPWLHFLFVGDVEPEELAAADAPLLRQLRANPRCTFVGRRPYKRLPGFAAALDVALLPFSAESVNPAGSAMRFFLQLPFGTPILATPGCLQLEEQGDLLTLCRGPGELVGALETLRAAGFEDSRRHARWAASRLHTWEARADTLLPLIER